MKINFLTTDISNASGGAIYDKNFFEITKKVYPDVRLFNDHYFVEKYGRGNGLVDFNFYYRQSIRELMDCDYLVMNSRLYTRMLLFNVSRMMKTYPKTKVLVIHHHSNYMNNEGVRKTIHKCFEKRVLKSATELIIPNKYVIDQVKKDFGIQTITFLPSSFEKKEYPLSLLDSNILLFVGNVEKRKGLMYGIKAFKDINKELPELEFHIAGKFNKQDKYYLALNKYIEQNDLKRKVIFEGRVDDNRLAWLYENAKLFLFPSMLEGYGWVMVEAMAHGLPVVAFNNSAMPYTVKDNVNGLLIDNKDIKEMAKRTIGLLKDNQKMKKLQEGALDTYEHVPSQETLNMMTEEYIRAWRKNCGAEE